MITIDIPPKPHWAGPFDGGITQSLISSFQVCPFQSFLYLYMGLQEAKPHEDNLMWGDTLHKGLEHRLQGDSLDDAISAMWEYQKKKYPTAPSTFRYTTRNMLALYPIKKLEAWGKITTEYEIVEKYTLSNYFQSTKGSYTGYNLVPKAPVDPETARLFFQELDQYGGETITFRGKVDMLSECKRKMGDHKAKGKHSPHPESVKEELPQDLQMNAYAYFMGMINEWIYDIIRCPEAMPRTPKRRNSQTPEQWADWIFHTHNDIMNGFPIKTCPGMWINQVQHWQSDEEIQSFMNFTLIPIFHKVVAWWHHVTHPQFDPNDPRWYGPLFYKAPVRNFNPTSTYSYKCKYHAYLIGKADINTLVPVHSYYPELEHK